MTDVQQLLEEASAPLKRQADHLRQTIADREAALEAELAPKRSELRELEAAIARIMGTPTPGSASGRAPRGHNRHLIIDYVAANPLATPMQISAATQIASATVYATLAKLVQDGRLVKIEKDGRVAYDTPRGGAD